MNGLVDEYRRKPDDELLRLWQNQAQLMPQATTCLAEEMARRQIGAFSPSGGERTPAQGTSAGPAAAGMQAAGVATAPYTTAPPFAGYGAKPPWTPNVAGVISFFFGPFAGALVCSISLRRMGHPEKARKALLTGAVGVVGLSVVLFFTPDGLARVFGLVAEIASVAFFRGLQKVEFAQWTAASPGVKPAGGWKAVGWGLIGIFLFLVITFVVFFGLALLLQFA